jgi:hypothetical protein
MQRKSVLLTGDSGRVAELCPALESAIGRLCVDLWTQEPVVDGGETITLTKVRTMQNSASGWTAAALVIVKFLHPDALAFKHEEVVKVVAALELVATG